MVPTRNKIIAAISEPRLIGTWASFSPLFDIFRKISVDTDMPVSVGRIKGFQSAFLVTRDF
jgi:hypothetical protein